MLNDDGGEVINYDALKNTLVDNNLRALSNKKLGILIRRNHSEFLKRFVYTWHTKGDYFIISYFTGTCKATNSRLFPECACGAANSTGHAASECEKILGATKREYYTEKITRVYKANRLPPQDSLHAYLQDIYFAVDPISFQDPRDLKSLIKWMKEIIMSIILWNEEKNEKIETYVSDDELEGDKAIERRIDPLEGYEPRSTA
jgi:hypothetical protein